jgi:hypothetical protein
MNTDQLVSHARARFEHSAARRLLKEKYQAKMTFAHAGGMWSAGPELLNTLMCCPGTESVVLDLYNNPVKVVTTELFNLTQQRWQEHMNAWLIEYQEISKNR